MKFIIDVSRSHLFSQAALNSLPVNMRYDPIPWMCINRGNYKFHQLNQDTPEHERAVFSNYFNRTGLNPGMSQTVGTGVYIYVPISPSVVSDSLWPHGLKPTRLLCPCIFPSQNIGVFCHFLLQGIFPTQGLYPHLLYYRWILYSWVTWQAPYYIQLYLCLSIFYVKLA